MDDGHVVRASVRDEGPGVPEAHRARIFDRFYRVDPARAAGGVGLGLAIVKGIVELHGGTVSVASAPGRGTCVTLLLPVEGG